MKRILVASVCDARRGDDAFGNAVVRQLEKADLPQGVEVMDLGSQRHELREAITKGYDAVIFVDATSRGNKPGTISFLELEPNRPTSAPELINSRDLDPVSLQPASPAEPPMGRLYLVDCEPASTGENEPTTLSRDVAAAIPRAIDMIRCFVRVLIHLRPTPHPGSNWVPATN